MKRKRIYRSIDWNTPCFRVELQETYQDSQHWRLLAYPRGYGKEPLPLEFGVRSIDAFTQEEGYGIFRIEIANSIARALTGANDYSDE